MCNSVQTRDRTKNLESLKAHNNKLAIELKIYPAQIDKLMKLVQVIEENNTERVNVQMYLQSMPRHQ